jgi:hypothetical protein
MAHKVDTALVWHKTNIMIKAGWGKLSCSFPWMFFVVYAFFCVRNIPLGGVGFGGRLCYSMTVLHGLCCVRGLLGGDERTTSRNEGRVLAKGLCKSFQISFFCI